MKAICLKCRRPSKVKNKCNYCGDTITIVVESSRPLRAFTNPNAPYYLQNHLPDSIMFSIVVLSYNGLDFTKKCIESVVKNTKSTYELIVVDNGSDKEVQEYLKYEGKITKLVLNKDNHGVAGGRNIGVSRAEGELVVFLDNDAELGKNWDKMVLETVKNNNYVGLVGSRGNVTESLNPIWFSISYANEFRVGTFDVDVVPGFFQVFPRRLVDWIGYLDETNGKFWHEDLEFCKRIKTLGLRVIANTELPVTHFGHGSVAEGKKISDSEMKKRYPGFEAIAKVIGKKYVSSNIVTIYRSVHDDCNEAFCLIADNMTRILRRLGFIVIRKPTLFGMNKSFGLCKGVEIVYEGLRYVVPHVENVLPPESWKEELEPVDKILCPSEHVRLSLLSFGIDHKKLLDQNPDGFDNGIYNPQVEPIDIGTDDFIFLTAGAAQPRKGTDILIKAFADTFSKNEPVTLVIKNYGYGQNEWVNKILDQYPDIKVKHIYDNWSASKLAGLYKRAAINGAFVQPHRGEAYGMCLLEALATGCRIGTTGFGGPKTILNYPDMVKFFDYDLVPSTFHNNEKEPYYGKEENPKWAEPKISQVKNWLRGVYETPYGKNADLMAYGGLSKETFDSKVFQLVKLWKGLNY